MVIALSLLALFVHADNPAEVRRRELRDVLARVIRAGPERFRPLQGARIDVRPGRTFWYQARVNLPGAEDCRVYDAAPPKYTCEWTKRRYADLVSDIEAVLPEGWKRADQAGAVRFESSAKKMHIDVQPRPVRITVVAEPRL